jgi:hypothetical protein
VLTRQHRGRDARLLVAAFVLLPLVGMEVSFFAAACAYGAVAALSWPGSSHAGRRPALVARSSSPRRSRCFLRGCAAPTGHIDEYWRGLEGSRGGREEGLSETVFLLRRESLGQPLSWRMLTNGTSMSGTDFQARRYMGLFVWLPAALHPEPRARPDQLRPRQHGTHAHGHGGARAARRVVDVSPDVLRLSPVVARSRATTAARPEVRCTSRTPASSCSRAGSATTSSRASRRRRRARAS